jgi:hypothetical protein
MDISNPALPDSAGSCDTPGSARGVAISGDHAFVADGPHGLQSVDISDNSDPDSVGSCGTPGEAYRVAVSGDYAYVADGFSGLQVVDISNPCSLHVVGSYGAPDDVYDVAISGNYAYLAENLYGLEVIDISDPTGPVSVARHDTPGEARAVCIEGDFAFVADAASGLRVVDISDPTDPDSAGGYDTPDWAGDVVVSGNHAFLADRYQGLQVIQVFQRDWNIQGNTGRSLVVNPVSERILRASLCTAQSDSIYWRLSADSGNSWREFTPDTAWHKLENPGGGLLWESRHVYDASTGVNPACDALTLEWLYDCAVVDSIVDVPGDQGGWVRIYFTRSGLDFTEEEGYPITDYYVFLRTEDASPTSIASRQGSGTVHPILSDELPPGTWELVDSVETQQVEQYVRIVPTLEDSSAPLVYSVYCILAETETPSVHFFSPPDSGYSVDNVTAVSEGKTTPAVTQLERIAPNPSNPTTKIRFTVAEPGRVVLVVFDVTGRVVRVLVNGWRERGRYEITWDGRNTLGEEVASGVYLCRLEAPGHDETGKLVLLR